MKEQARDQLLEGIRRELFGPAGGNDEVIKGRPAWRYLCGMLFPPEIDDTFLKAEEEGDEAIGPGDGADVAIALAYESLPSSMGVSFFVTCVEKVKVFVEAGRYEKGEGKSSEWYRIPLASDEQPLAVELVAPGNTSRVESVSTTIFGGRAGVEAVFRPRDSGYLVTVTLVNRTRPSGNKPSDQVAAMLFQCRFAIDVLGGEIGAYQDVSGVAPHQEDEELALIYRHRRTRGIGHGCAATWDSTEHPLTRIVADPVPTYTLRPMTTEIDLPEDAARALSLQWLANPGTPREELALALSRFVSGYEIWITRQASLASTMPPHEAVVAERLVERQRRALDRMRAGVELLTRSRDPQVLAAFKVAQEVMLLQFAWSRRAAEPKLLGHGDTKPIDIWSSMHAESPAWRPFQLAFQLLTIESVASDTSLDREVLDLLWFPTGGGKTEAYLALVAFEIVHRRLKYGDAGTGTAAIMRYTLRLLTSQQFERAASMISVLETFRRTRPDLGLGEVPIRLGLWVGGATSPNKLSSDSDKAPGAVQLFDELLSQDQPENPFQLRTCPSCGTQLVPARKGTDFEYGFRVDATRFEAYCPDRSCILNDGIPVSVVDEDLVNRPPAFLIGTIDKFARLVWDASFRVFLGLGHSDVLPPKLIVQDELHLINGPLGTIAGAYEAAIDTVLRESGVVPKYIAATATIQRAQDQCRALYGREAFTFPPSGLDAEDSYFSREEESSPGEKRGRGRTYVGAMGHGMYSGLTSLVQVSSAVAHAAATLPDTPNSIRDTYWTQVIYHNSRQELGKTTTMLMDDVRSRLELIEAETTETRNFSNVEELSANVRGTQLTQALQNLRVQWPEVDVIDAVACTNIISVGVDVSRLGLMVVKSQPKATAEYIQASSRVGRDAGRPPGVVVTLYASNRPRDRSHYESFQSYHQSLYRTVEPTSVTPFAPPARDRTLHAALVLTLRHLMGWVEGKDVQKFARSDPRISAVITALKERLKAACRPDEWPNVEQNLDDVAEEWERLVSQVGSKLRFSTGNNAYTNLLGGFPAGVGSRGEWPTLNSMRHVDGESPFGVHTGSG